MVPTLAEFVSDVEHRISVKHLYGNFRKKYPGQDMKQALWRAARASTLPEFTKAMEEMKNLNEAAYIEMNALPHKMWSRSSYSNETQCDLQVNNMCEAFNRAILDHREKPIITMLEGLKFYLNNRIVRQRDMMGKWKTDICPLIQQKLERAKKASDKWMANWSGDAGMNLFEVIRDNEKCVVDSGEKTCACRRWDLCGIPCYHAISCIYFAKRIPEDYISDAYR